LDTDSSLQLLILVLLLGSVLFLTTCRLNLKMGKGASKQNNEVAFMLSSVLIWVIVAVLSIKLALRILGDKIGSGIAGLFLILCYLGVNKIMAEGIGKKGFPSAFIAEKTAVIIRFLMYPGILLFNTTQKIWKKILSIEEEVVKEGQLTDEEVLDFVTTELGISAADENLINQAEKTMLYGVIEFADIIVKEVMTPRPDVVGVDKKIAYEDLLKVIKEKQFSRLPVYKETIDHILGVMHIKDLLLLPEQKEAFSLEQYIRPTIFVPETRKISELFRVMKKEKIHLVVVLDEYGSTAGIVTLEDLIEEIMGDIQDEHDREEPPWKYLSDHVMEIKAGVRLDELNEVLDLNLDTEAADTLGGLIFALLDRIPEVGDRVFVENLEFVVEGMDGHRIEKVHLILPVSEAD